MGRHTRALREGLQASMSLLCLKSLSAQPFQDKNQRLVSAYISPYTHTYSVSVSLTQMQTYAHFCPQPIPFYRLSIPIFFSYLLPFPLFLSPSLPNGPSTFHSCFLHIPHLFPLYLLTQCLPTVSIFISHTYVHTFFYTYSFTYTHTHRILKMLNNLHFLESTTFSPISFN